MKTEFDKYQKYQLLREDHEMLKLKPHALLITTIGQMKVGETVLLYSKPDHLKESNFTVRLVKEITKGNNSTSEFVTLIDKDLVLAEEIDNESNRLRKVELDKLKQKRIDEKDYKQSLFLQCQKDMEEFD